MLFNSIEFILFFALITTFYFVFPFKYRWAILLIASCIFYMFFIPKYILVLFLTIFIDYYTGILIEKYPGRKRLFLILSIITNLGILVFFKYYNFLIENVNIIAEKLSWNYNIELLKIILPIGLSFHTFQAMSYTIEVFRGNQKAERHFGIYALYVMYYPQLVAGPIERPQNIIFQFHKNKNFDYDLFRSGILLMLWGYFKKVVIADKIAYFINPVFNEPQNYEGISLFIAAIFFSIQIYCDFSGYCDIGIGASKTMGIKLMNNFNRPYSAKTIEEFWSRWHISLSTWFKDYLYIPLGGNRLSTFNWCRNIFIVFLISGLWHGANWTFIFWGALHACYILLSHAIKKIKNKFIKKTQINFLNPISHYSQVLTTFFLVTIAWIFFRVETISKAIFIIKKIFIGILIYFENIFYDTDFLWLEPLTFNLNFKFEFLILILSIIALESLQYFNQKFNIKNYLFNKPLFVRWSVYTLIIFYILIFGSFHNTSEFIYFQF